MVKRCQWGLCNSDSRYPERLAGGITFIPFPKPKRSLEKCKRWIKACGRPNDQLNISILDGNYHAYVCIKHFQEGKPTDRYPDPMPVDQITHCTARPPPKRPSSSEQPSKRKQLLSDNPNREKENSVYSVPSTSSFSGSAIGGSSLELLALAAENQMLKQKLARQELLSEVIGSSTPITSLQKKTTSLEKQTISQEKQKTILGKQRNSFEKQTTNLVKPTTSLGEQRINLEKPTTSLEEQRISLEKQTTSLGEQRISLEKQADIASKKDSIFVESLRDSPLQDTFKCYTGFEFIQFMHIFKFLVPDDKQYLINYTLPVSISKELRLEDQLLLTLIKLRLDFEFDHLAYLFQISPEEAAVIFTNWINYMFYRFDSVPMLPDRQFILQNMPATFKQNFPNTFLILAAIEIQVERPVKLLPNKKCQSKCITTTLKGLVGINPNGSFTFVSMLFPGSMSVQDLTEKSELLKSLHWLLSTGRLERGDGVVLPSSFTIHKEIQNFGLRPFMAEFGPILAAASASNVATAENISSHLAHVNRAISRVKSFKIVDNVVEPTLCNCISQIWYCCCLLTGFMPLLITD